MTKLSNISALYPLAMYLIIISSSLKLLVSLVWLTIYVLNYGAPFCIGGWCKLACVVVSVSGWLQWYTWGGGRDYNLSPKCVKVSKGSTKISCINDNSWTYRTWISMWIKLVEGKYTVHALKWFNHLDSVSKSMFGNL